VGYLALAVIVCGSLLFVFFLAACGIIYLVERAFYRWLER
jgi:hypothetical protein